MAIVVHGSNHSPSSSGVVTITKPTGVTNGDLLLACIGASSAVESVPVGWTQFANVGTSYFSQGYYKFVTNAGGEPASYAWDAGGTGSVGGITRISGVDTTSFVDLNLVTQDNAATHPGITTTVDGALVILSIRASATVTGPAQMTLAWQRFNSTSAVNVYTEARPTAGATGSRSHTGGTPSADDSWMISLRPTPTARPSFQALIIGD